MEGAAEKNPRRRHGYPRAPRPACEQRVIALSAHSGGFPFREETLEGHRADQSTRETILRRVERTYGPARWIRVSDRGLVSGENRQATRKRSGPSLVGTPRSRRKQFAEERWKDGGTRVRPDVEVKNVAIPQRRLRCCAAGRAAGQKSQPSGIAARLAGRRPSAQTIETGRRKDRNKRERRLGRIPARPPQGSDLEEVARRDPPDGVRLHWSLREDRKIGRGLGEGASLLRTHLQGGTAAELRPCYRQWTEAEVSFRALQRERSLRPWFHPWEPRGKAHVLVAWLGYAWGVTREPRWKRRAAVVPPPSLRGATTAQPLSASKALAWLSTRQSAALVLPTTGGQELRLRRMNEPTAEQQALLEQRGLTLPERFEPYRKCSADSATA